MPLAFTQEDFLVFQKNDRFYHTGYKNQLEQESLPARNCKRRTARGVTCPCWGRVMGTPVLASGGGAPSPHLNTPPLPSPGREMGPETGYRLLPEGTWD